jgi:hypothetical protein
VGVQDRGPGLATVSAVFRFCKGCQDDLLASVPRSGGDYLVRDGPRWGDARLGSVVLTISAECPEDETLWWFRSWPL